jgi:hypothetical protein
MFGLLKRAGTKPFVPPQARPLLETLEDRAVPAALTLSVSYMTGKWVTLSGNYSNAQNVANVAIQVSGQASGVAWTNFQGAYSVAVEAVQLGAVTVQATDLSTAAVSKTLTDQAPVLTGFIVSEQTLSHLFSGTISYHRPIGADTMTVNFGGEPVTLQGKTTEVLSDSTFSEAWTLNGQQSDNGTAWAEVVSPWGLVSNRVYAEVLQTPADSGNAPSFSFVTSSRR